MDEGEREREDVERAEKSRRDKQKGSQVFLQKFWHKGAFHQVSSTKVSPLDVLMRCMLLTARINLIGRRHPEVSRLYCPCRVDCRYINASQGHAEEKLWKDVSNKGIFTTVPPSCPILVVTDQQLKALLFSCLPQYTHLADQDTTRDTGGFGNASAYKGAGGGDGCFTCGGPHMKKGSSCHFSSRSPNVAPNSCLSFRLSPEPMESILVLDRWTHRYGLKQLCSGLGRKPLVG